MRFAANRQHRELTESTEKRRGEADRWARSDTHRRGDMVLFELVTELETEAPAANAVSPVRLLTIGKYLGLMAGQRVIDFGCGRAEMLCLWAKCFGVTGIGIDLDAALLADAQARAARWGISDKVEFLHLAAQAYDRGAATFDVAACMGATMAFGGFVPTIRYLKGAISAGGSIVVAEPFFTAHEVPPELRAYEGGYRTEEELFEIVRSEGLEVGYYSRASRDEWDRYIFGSRSKEMQEFLSMPPGPAREERRVRLHRWQDMYLRYRQTGQGMAFVTLHPA